MKRPLMLAAGLVVLVAVLVAGRYLYRSLMQYEGMTPDGYPLLTAVRGSSGFEPTSLPVHPVLDNTSTSDLAVDFGYKVGGIPYSYSLVLAFPPGSDHGRARMTVRHSERGASTDVEVIRRWDEPRKAWAVALQQQFDIQPNVPSLCVKAVIGPSDTGYDLKDGSICIAQRDGAGVCHTETLACGQIR